MIATTWIFLKETASRNQPQERSLSQVLCCYFKSQPTFWRLIFGYLLLAGLCAIRIININVDFSASTSSSSESSPAQNPLNNNFDTSNTSFYNFWSALLNILIIMSIENLSSDIIRVEWKKRILILTKNESGSKVILLFYACELLLSALMSAIIFLSNKMIITTLLFTLINSFILFYKKQLQKSNSDNDTIEDIDTLQQRLEQAINVNAGNNINRNNNLNHHNIQQYRFFDDLNNYHYSQHEAGDNQQQQGQNEQNDQVEDEDEDEQSVRMSFWRRNNHTEFNRPPNRQRINTGLIRRIVTLIEDENKFNNYIQTAVQIVQISTNKLLIIFQQSKVRYAAIHSCGRYLQLSKTKIDNSAKVIKFYPEQDIGILQTQKEEMAENLTYQLFTLKNKDNKLKIVGTIAEIASKSYHNTLLFHEKQFKCAYRTNSLCGDFKLMDILTREKASMSTLANESSQLHYYVEQEDNDIIIISNKQTLIVIQIMSQIEMHFQPNYLDIQTASSNEDNNNSFYTFNNNYKHPTTNDMLEQNISRGSTHRQRHLYETSSQIPNNNSEIINNADSNRDDFIEQDTFREWEQLIASENNNNNNNNINNTNIPNVNLLDASKQKREQTMNDKKLLVYGKSFQSQIGEQIICVNILNHKQLFIQGQDTNYLYNLAIKQVMRSVHSELQPHEIQQMPYVMAIQIDNLNLPPTKSLELYLEIQSKLMNSIITSTTKSIEGLQEFTNLSKQVCLTQILSKTFNIKLFFNAKKNQILYIIPQIKQEGTLESSNNNKNKKYPTNIIHAFNL